MAPVCNFAHYEVLALAEMETPAAVVRPPDAAGGYSGHGRTGGRL